MARGAAASEIAYESAGNPVRPAAVHRLPPPPSARHRPRILIASGHPIVRYGLRALLAEAGDLDMVGEAEDGARAVALAAQLRPDTVVMDLMLPEIDAITATRQIRAAAPDTGVVVITGVNDSVPAIEAIRAGAAAYLPKETRADVMVRTIRSATTGHVALPMQMMARLVRIGDRPEALSNRESDVMRLVAAGQSNKQIARELAIAHSTVKTHVGSILSKLGLASRTRIAMFAARSGLVSLDHSS